MSELTGPDGAIDGDNYMYAEASAPQKPADNAILQSDITFPGYCSHFSFLLAKTIVMGNTFQVYIKLDLNIFKDDSRGILKYRSRSLFSNHVYGNHGIV